MCSLRQGGKWQLDFFNYNYLPDVDVKAYIEDKLNSLNWCEVKKNNERNDSAALFAETLSQLLYESY